LVGFIASKIIESAPFTRTFLSTLHGQNLIIIGVHTCSLPAILASGKISSIEPAMNQKKDAMKALAQEAALMPQEELVAVHKRQSRIAIGIPRETSFQERRVALVPESVALLVNNGHDVVVETNAGKESNFQDHDYSEAGARIVYSPEDVFR